MHSDLSMKPPSTIPAFVLSLLASTEATPSPRSPPDKRKQMKRKIKRSAPFSHPAIEEEASRCCPCCFFFFPFPVGRRAFGLVYPAPPPPMKTLTLTPPPRAIAAQVGTPPTDRCPPFFSLGLPSSFPPSSIPPLRHHGEVPRSSLVVEPERWGRPGRLALHAWSAPVTHPVMLERPTVQIRRWSPAQLNALMSSNPLAARQVIASNRFAWQSILQRDMITD
jgi:hypothetical protein